MFLSSLCVASQPASSSSLDGNGSLQDPPLGVAFSMHVARSIKIVSFVLSSIQVGGEGNLVSESMLRCWEEEEEEAEEDRGESRVSSSFQPFVQCMRRGKVFGSTFANNISG